MEIYQLKNLIKQPTCFKSDSPTCTALILTNRHSSCQNSLAIETGFSDFHSMVVIILKSGFMKRGLRIVLYRDYSKFDANTFRQALKDYLNEVNREVEDFLNLMKK